MSLGRRSIAEMVGTFWLVLGGCGSAVLAAAFPGLGIGFAGVALAFGLSVLTMAYALGGLSGAHFNPAVSVGLWLGGRFPGRDVPAYIAAQVAGALLAGGVLYAIASGAPGFSPAGGFAANGYGAHSPGGYALPSAALCELVLTCGFLLVIMGVTDPKRAPAGFGAARDRIGADAHTSHQHPGDQHIGEPGAQHRRRAVRRRLGVAPALAVLAGAAPRRRGGRAAVPRAGRAEPLALPEHQQQGA